MYEITVTVVGNLVDDVQFRTLDDGTAVASFRLANNERYFNRGTGQWVDGEPAYFTVSCWRATAQNIRDSLAKGMPVVVTGRLRQRHYEREIEGGTTQRVMYNAIEATVVGPDLSRGVASFQRVKSPTVQRQEAYTVADAMGAESMAAADRAADDPSQEPAAA